MPPRVCRNTATPADAPVRKVALFPPRPPPTTLETFEASERADSLSGEDISMLVSEVGSSESEKEPSMDDHLVRRSHSAVTNDENAIHLDGRLGNLEDKEKISTTSDIRYFFTRTAQGTTCNPCKAVHDADPAAWTRRYPNRVRIFQYSRSTGTTSLRGHIDRHHLLDYLHLADSRNWPIFVDTVKNALALGYTLKQLYEISMAGGSIICLPRLSGLEVNGTSDESGGTQGRHRVPRRFSLEELHERLVAFVVADGQSLDLVECREFRSLLLLCEGLRESDIPRPTELRQQVVVSWTKYFVALKDELAHALGRISFTADIWSDQIQRPFLAMTGHWVSSQNGSLQLRSALVALHRLRRHHTGKSLAKTILYLLDRIGCTSKVGHFAMDATGHNKTALKELEALLDQREIEFNALERHITCCPRAIHDCVTHVVESFADAELDDGADAWIDAFPDAAEREAHAEAVRRDPIAMGREIVDAVRASGLELADMVKTGNVNHWFKGPGGESEKVPELELLRDVGARWDSTYMMINRLRAMRLAVDCFLSLPNQKELQSLSLSSTDWSVLLDFERILQIPHRVQQLVSRESLPRLGSAVPCFEILVSAWEKLGEEFPRTRPWVRVGLHWASKHYQRVSHTTAPAVLAMVVDPAIRMSWIRRHWARQDIELAESLVLDTMRTYRAGLLPSRVPTQYGDVSPRTIDSLAAQFGIDDLNAVPGGGRWSRRFATDTVEEEYRSYVEGSLLDEAMDPLRFWETKRETLPTLFQVAMDHLPIQASTVSCERVFSSGAETSAERRDRGSSPTLVEALRMLKYRFEKRLLDFSCGRMTDRRELAEDVVDRYEGLPHVDDVGDPDAILSRVAREGVDDSEVPLLVDL